ncbi:ANTAR domain-containing protein [Mycobacterium colombiense]|uniref:ANTAR domain-containing protein n=1 Tax=Mycobacterium colombiense TaxID=339268 RepID=UPI000AC80AE6|nr:ANTAR domain-containing protein [Mycobacterium colombiense]
MPANRRISRVLDGHRFDALAARFAPGSSKAALMFLDPDLRIRGLNAPYEAISLRKRDEMLGGLIADVFPENSDDPQASGLELLAASVEAALARNGTDVMPIMRYDIIDPRDPGVFLPKVWTARNLAIHDGDGHTGVLHQVTEITSFDQALSALSLTSAGGRTYDAAAQLHVLAALSAQSRSGRDPMTQEIEQLRRALETRDIIGQAKGMLMERFDIDAAAAFDLLVRLSQSSNTPVAEIAEKLVKLEHSRR